MGYDEKMNPSGLPYEGYYYSAYGIAVKHGFKGTEEEWLQSLVGKGEKGDTGAAGNGISNVVMNDDGSWTVTLEDGTEIAVTGEYSHLEDLAEDAEAYGAGTRGGTDVTSGDPAYHNNAKYYAQLASGSASAASGSASAASGYADNAADSASAAASTKSAVDSAVSQAVSAKASAESAAATAASNATIAGGYATAAAGSASAASLSASAADSAKGDAQSYASAANTAKGDALNAQTAAETAQGLAETAQAAAASWATGGSSGTPSASNNAAYYANQAAASAVLAGDAQTAAETAQTAAEAAQTAAEAAQAAAQSAAASVDAVELNRRILASFPTDSVSSVPAASFSDGADGIPVKRMTVNITPAQSGSGDPAPDNVRPISGWTGANIMQTGENLMAVPMVVLTSSSAWSPTGFFLKAGAYSLAFDVSTAISWRLGIKVYDSKGNAVGNDNNYKPTCSVSLSWNSSRQIWGFGANTTATTYGISFPQDCQVAFCLWSGDVSSSTTLSNVMLNVGNTEQPYAPYVGTTYPVSWQSAAGTVYGGVLTDSGDGTWTLSVTKGGHVFDGTENLYDSSSMLSRCANYNIQDMWMSSYGVSTRTEGLNCSHFKPSQTVLSTDNRADRVLPYTDGTSRVIGFGYSENVGTDLVALKSYMATQYANGTPVTIMFKLASALDVQLTAESVKTLLGANNILCDTGDVAALTYRADPTLYIGKKLAALGG